MENKEILVEPSTVENIDLAIYKWLDEELNLYTNTNNGFTKVPVIWILGERAHQIKNDFRLRDNQGTFILPVITLERVSINKDLNKKGRVWSAVPEISDERGGAYEIGRRIVQNKSTNFARATNKRKFNQLNYPNENKKIVYETLSIPLPIYTTITYTINIKTQYQQQMNDLISPFMTLPGGVNSFMTTSNGHRYTNFIKGEISQENNTNNLSEDERLFSSKITIETLGYLIGLDKNQNKPKVAIRQNIVEVKIPRERVIIGDIDENEKNKRTI